MSKALLTALPSIYDAALSDERWPATLDAVARSLGVFGGVLFAVDLVGRDFELTKWSSVYPDDEVERYLARFGIYEAQAVDFMRDKPARKIYTETDVWPDYDPLSTREDIAYLRERFGVRRRVGVRLNKDRGWSDLLALQLQRDRHAQPARFQRTLGLMLPHIAKVVETNRLFTLLRQRHQAALSSLDKIGVGMCVSDARGRLLITNQEAGRIFAADDGLRVRADGTLQASDDALSAALRAATLSAALAAAGDANCGEHAFACPRRSGAAPFLVEICPLRDSAGELEPSLAGALVTIIDPEQTKEISIAGLATLFGFTPAETEVCQGLVSGLTANELAESRSVSPQTIKTQVAALYAKTGLSRRYELIRLAVTTSPPIR